LLHDNAPVQKAAFVCQFLTPKNVTTLYHPVLSRFTSARLFSVPQVENEVKRPPFCECCRDQISRNWFIKEDPKRGTFGSFSETLRPRKSLYICKWSLFWIKKKKHVSSSCVFDLKKNISPNFWTALCVYYRMLILFAQKHSSCYCL
jgi:hypothetical protein